MCAKEPPSEAPYWGGWINCYDGTFHPDIPEDVKRSFETGKVDAPEAEQETFDPIDANAQLLKGQITETIIIGVYAKVGTAMARICRARAASKGFPAPSSYDDVDMILAKSMLIVSELGEFVEAVRKGDVPNANEELADVLIRLYDLCGALDIDIGVEVAAKMAVNRNRPYMHGKRA